MTLRSMNLLFLVAFLSVGVSTTAWAQYGGGTSGGGTSTSSTYSGNGGYGNGAAVAVGVGAAVAVVAIVLYVHHKHSMKAAHAALTGCAQVAGNQATLLDEKEKKVYSLVGTDDNLKPGERVELAGYRTRNRSGKRIFEVQSLTRDLGACGAATARKLDSEPGKTNAASR